MVEPLLVSVPLIVNTETVYSFPASRPVISFCSTSPMSICVAVCPCIAYVMVNPEYFPSGFVQLRLKYDRPRLPNERFSTSLGTTNKVSFQKSAGKISLWIVLIIIMYNKMLGWLDTLTEAHITRRPSRRSARRLQRRPARRPVRRPARRPARRSVRRPSRRPVRRPSQRHQRQPARRPADIREIREISAP